MTSDRRCNYDMIESACTAIDNTASILIRDASVIFSHAGESVGLRALVNIKEYVTTIRKYAAELQKGEE